MEMGAQSAIQRKANLVEIFSSIQGEGMLVGFRQIFIRFAGCNLRCSYCDTPEALTVPETCQVPEFDLELPNPVELDQVLEVVNRFDPRIHHSVSLTGGEPLLQVEALEELLPALNQKSEIRSQKSETRNPQSAICNLQSAIRNPQSSMGYLTYLETNGSLPEQLKGVRDMMDIIAVDIHLPYSSGLVPQWDLQEQFLRLAAEANLSFTKIVVSAETDQEEFLRGVNLIRKVNPAIPLIIQPEAHNPPPPPLILSYHALAQRVLASVRVIPQIHRQLGLP